MSCLLRAAFGSEEEMAQKSTPNAFEDGGQFGVYEIDRHKDGSIRGFPQRRDEPSRKRNVQLSSCRALKIVCMDLPAKRSSV